MKLLEYLKNHFGVAFPDPGSFPVLLEEKKFNKGAILTDYGQIERKLYFINEGFVELTMLHEGDERVIDFFFPDSFVCAYTSFLRQEPSDVRVRVLNDCQAEIIHYNNLQEAYKSSLLANQLGRLLTEQIYMVKTKREKDFLTKSAQERYKELFARREDILQFIPINKIAKYLGILPESLSRIRKSIIS